MPNVQRSRFLVLLAVVACSSASSTAGGRGSSTPRASSDLITREQIENAKGLSNGYEIVEALHGNWLRLRSGNGTSRTIPLPVPTQRSDTGSNPYASAMAAASARDTVRSDPGAPAGIQVYLDGTRLGGLGELKRIPSQSIYSIRHYTGTDAQMRFGPGHSDGVIAVSTRPDSR